MNTSTRFEINGRTYTTEQLTDPVISTTSQSEFERSTLSFCHDWLTGKKEFMLTTSGSTGAPKPITLQREQMEASAQLTIHALQLKPGDHALVCLDTKYIAGQMMLVRSFVGNMNIIATEPVANPFKKLSHHKIDFAAFVPYQVDAILQEGYQHNLDNLKCAIIGGAAISETLRHKLQPVKSHLFATYGMTETISHIALQKLNGNDAHEYFGVLGNTKIRQDERGCLVIKTDYLDDELVTNDMVEIIDAKHFKWLGRFDHVINTGGVKIYPETVEKKIEVLFSEEQYRNRFFIAGLADGKLGQRVVLVIEGAPFDTETQSRIVSMLSPRLSKYELPKEIKFISSFTETKTGKVNRSKTIQSA